MCGLLCGCISTVTDHSNLPSKLGVPTRSPKLESESSEEASNPRTHNLQQDYLVLLMNYDLSINNISRFNLSLLASLDSLYVEKVVWVVCFCLFIKSRLALADPSTTLSAAGCLLACFLILPVHDEEGNIYRLYVFPIQAFTQLHKSKLKKLKFYNKKL